MPSTGELRKHLEFLGGRCRPNTVRAAAYDLKVFFTVAARPPDQVRPADVLAFIIAQRTGRAGGGGVLQPLKAGGEPGGVSAATVRPAVLRGVVSFAFSLTAAGPDGATVEDAARFPGRSAWL